ncbi:hypothetical protein EBZ39_02955 [bacterium]|nr:hypothetical protein [bacterium]
MTVSRDERNMLSVQVPFRVPTLDETLTVSAGAPFGLPEVGRAVNQLEGGAGYQVVITHEGTTGENEGEADGTIEFDQMFREEPLESHPNWDKIKAEYGGSVVDKELNFPEFLGNATTARVGTLTKGLTGDYADAARSSQRRNPLFGQKTYLALYVVYRRSYVRKTFPKGILDLAGSTRAKLPGGLPTPKGRNWLIQPPKVQRRGTSWEVTEEWILSKPGEEWPRWVFDVMLK